MIKNKKAYHTFLDMLSSMQLGLSLLIIIVIAAVFSTIIPQQQPLIFYQAEYGHVLGTVMFYGGFTAVYKSSWFLAAVFILLANLCACTYQRYRRYTKQINLRQYSSALLHLGLIVLIIGGLISAFWSKSSYFEVPVNGIIKMTDHGYPFDLRVDNFKIDYYSSKDTASVEPKQPKQYRSQLTVLSDGKELYSKEIKVNHPLNFKGTKVYQANYGLLIQGQLTNEGKTREFKVTAGEITTLGGNYLIKAVPASGDYNAPEENGVLYGLYQQNKPFLGRANLNEKIDLPCGTIQFTAVKPFTGLEVKRDPGVPVVWTGFFLVTVGLTIRLYCKN